MSNVATVNDIVAYENGEMDEEETIEFFQRLINSGLAWRLQGSYGRMARTLLDQDLVTMPSPFEVIHG